MNKYLILSILILSFTNCKVKQSLPIGIEQKEYVFPFDWIGHYKGSLDIYKENKQNTQIDMELIIGSPNGEGFYPWTIIYNEKDVRKYGLEAINADFGHYRIDEYNSIQIDGFLNNGHFVSRFDVMGNDLLVDYYRTDKGIDVNFYISKAESLNITGGEIIAQDTVPNVKSYPILVFQKAELNRIND